MIIGHVTKVNDVIVPSSRLVEHGTRHDTIGSILSTSESSTYQDGVTRTPYNPWIFFQLLFIFLDIQSISRCLQRFVSCGINICK